MSPERYPEGQEISKSFPGVIKESLPLAVFFLLFRYHTPFSEEAICYLKLKKEALNRNTLPCTRWMNVSLIAGFRDTVGSAFSEQAGSLFENPCCERNHDIENGTLKRNAFSFVKDCQNSRADILWFSICTRHFILKFSAMLCPSFAIYCATCKKASIKTVRSDSNDSFLLCLNADYSSKTDRNISPQAPRFASLAPNTKERGTTFEEVRLSEGSILEWQLTFPCF